MRRTASLLTLVLALVAGLTSCANAGASSSGNTRNVKIAAINLVTFSPVYVAQKLGYFKAEGLHVTIVPTNSGDASAQAMLGRSVDAATAGFDTPVQLTAKGQQVQSLVGMEMRTIYAFVGGKDFPRIPADDPKAFAAAIKGKRLGVASSGSTGDTIARGIFKEYGLTPDKDVKIMDVGTGAAAAAALKSGAVDAVISYEPDVSSMTTSGIGHVVFDLRTSTAETTYSRLPTSTLQATTAWIKANPKTAAALVRAVAKADDVIHNDPKVALPVLKGLYPDLSAKDVEHIYATSHDHFVPAIPEATYTTALGVYRSAGLVGKDVPYSSVVASQFAKDWTS